MTREEFFYQCIDIIEHWLNGNRKISDLREVTDKLYNEGTRPNWISVEDELPKIGKDVLVLREDGEMQVAHQYNEEITRWWSVDGFPLKNNITHWMPLPQAPSSSEKPNNCDKGGEE